jgi:hypothetical protein
LINKTFINLNNILNLIYYLNIVLFVKRNFKLKLNYGWIK